MKAIAYHLRTKLLLHEIETLFSFKLLKKELSYLFYGINTESFFYVKNFGSIGFINCSPELIEECIIKILEKVPVNLVLEEYDIVLTKMKEENVYFNEIYLKQLDINSAQVILFNLAQSAAMSFYNDESLKLIQGIASYSKQLEQKGDFLLSFKRMRKFIGETMNIKNRIAQNLYIFEKTNLAWSNETLSRLDEQLSTQLDTINRYRGLEINLNIVKENLDFFQSIMQHKHSSKLEWIIILLILFEVIQIIF